MPQVSTMDLQQLIKTENVLCNAQARSKKHCLEILSELLVQNHPEISNDEIFSKLVERERLGCTSLEQGVALPRCRVDGLANSSGALIKLSDAVDFDSQDGHPVDLVFALMVPEEVEACHHADIELISTTLASDPLRARLRAATSSSELYDAFVAAQINQPTKTQPHKPHLTRMQRSQSG